MTIITAEQAAANFAALAELLIQSAPTPKAVDFAHRVITQVQAKGAAWMAQNLAPELLDDPRTLFCPVADNRGFWMGKLQMALLG